MGFVSRPATERRILEVSEIAAAQIYGATTAH